MSVNNCEVFSSPGVAKKDSDNTMLPDDFRDYEFVFTFTAQ